MTKRDVIDRIMQRNPTAKPEFLCEFDAGDLEAYLRQLEAVQPVSRETVKTMNEPLLPAKR